MIAAALEGAVMHIGSDHRLAPGWYRASPNIGGPLRDPTLLVMHYTASGGQDGLGDVDWLCRPEARASAHVVVGRSGDVKQIVPFDVQAWHAGRSIWRGRSNCNDFSIGIEVDNWGKLARNAAGEIVSSTGRSVDQHRALRLRHKHESAPQFWEVYDEVQLVAVAAVARLILDAYPSIREIVGHEDIAPGRKSDPGPAFPMQRFISLVEGRGDAPVLHRRVLSSSLNVRGGPGVRFGLVGEPLVRDERVEVEYDAGAWARIKAGDGRIGWVADQFLGPI
jgi:N-acetylmuramoyl-L-alanine amidase